MANENLKKFLDSAGVGHLWGKVTEKIAADVKVEADRAKAEELKLQNKFGDLGESTVKAYVDAKTEGIASEGVVTDLSNRVGVIEGDYVKAADIANFETKENVQKVVNDLAGYIGTNNQALAGVKATADAAAVKTEVEAALALKADKTALQETDNTLAALKARVEAFLDNTGAATEAIDTLQELLEYIDAHDAVELAADIQALENKTVLGTDAEGNEYATVKAYVEAVIEALAIGDYAKASDLLALTNRVKALEDKPAAGITAEQIGNWDGEVGAKALATSKATMDEVKAEINGRGYETVANVESKIEAAKTAVTSDLTTKIATAKGEAIAEAEKLNGLMDARVQAVETTKHTHANKGVLDGIDATDIEKWDAAQANAEATAKAYTDKMFGDIKALSNEEIDAAIAG